MPDGDLVMSLRLSFPLLAIALVLTGCGDKADEAKSPREVAKEAARMERPEPGKYRSTVKVLEFEIPGLPPQQAEQMKRMMQGMGGKDAEFCLTEQDAQGGFEEMVRKTQEGNCTFRRFDATANTLDAEMTCETAPGAIATIAMKGRTSADRLEMKMEMDQSAASLPGGKVHMKMEMTNERIGDCDPA